MSPRSPIAASALVRTTNARAPATDLSSDSSHPAPTITGPRCCCVCVNAPRRSPRRGVSRSWGGSRGASILLAAKPPPGSAPGSKSHPGGPRSRCHPPIAHRFPVKPHLPHHRPCATRNSALPPPRDGSLPTLRHPGRNPAVAVGHTGDLRRRLRAAFSRGDDAHCGLHARRCSSLLVHEFGHALTIRRFGAPTRIVLHAFGGYALHPAGIFDRKQQFLVSAAGPGLQLLLAGLAWLVMVFVPLPTAPARLLVFYLSSSASSGRYSTWCR